MAGRIEARLKELGIELPEAREPRVARIKGANIAGNILYVSGQVPQWNGKLKFIGKVGDAFTVEQGREAARLSALNVLAQAKKALIVRNDTRRETTQTTCKGGGPLPRD